MTTKKDGDVDLEGIIVALSKCHMPWGYKTSSEYFGRPLRAANAAMFAED
jgi:hypothetical protein